MTDNEKKRLPKSDRKKTVSSLPPFAACWMFETFKSAKITNGIRNSLKKSVLPKMFRAGKNNKLNFLWPKMSRLGPRFGPRNPPVKLFCVPSQEMRHINFLSGGPEWGVLAGGQKIYVERVYVLLPSLQCWGWKIIKWIVPWRRFQH